MGGKYVPELPPVPVVSEEYAQAHPCEGGARVVIPKEAETEEILHRCRVGPENQSVCGNCAHFDHRRGQHEIQDKRVWMRLFREQEHDPMWYGDLSGYGMCNQWDGHLTQINSPARVPRHLTETDVPYHLKDESVRCPYYKEAGSWRRRMISGRYTKSWEE